MIDIEPGRLAGKLSSRPSRVELINIGAKEAGRKLPRRPRLACTSTVK